jgi:hypothetical protein
MTERLERSRAGPPTVFVGDRALHSRYDPRREAETYLAGLDIPGGIRFFILPEPGLGYLIPALKRRFPGAGIIALHVSPFLAQKQGELNPGAAVWPRDAGASPEGVQDFLERNIPDLPAAQVRIVEWRPAREAFGEACLSLLRETAAFLRRADANARTGGFFGRRWVRNFFRNLPLLRRIVRYRPAGPDIPWIVAGAGPSLEESAAAIRERGGSALVLAAASAYAALAERGAAGDLVLAADGGAWALFHLVEALRRAGTAGGPGPVIAFSLTAALPSQCGDFPLLPLSDGTLWQGLVLRELGIPFLSLPSRGTVTALAVDLALRLTGGDVLLAGMDLSRRDIQAHARPYALDPFLDGGEGRLSPRYSRAFSRSMIPDGGSFRVYADWFKGQLARWPERLRSLGANHPVFGVLPPPDRAWGEAVTQSPWSPVPFRPLPLRRGIDALCTALEGPAPALVSELAPLLLPDSPDPSPAELVVELRALTAAAHG